MCVNTGHNMSPIISLWDFSKAQGPNGWILVNFKPTRDFRVVLVTCKNKNESVNSDIIMLPYSLGLVTSFFYQN